VVWLYTHDFAPFGYALESHPATLVEALVSGIGYLAGALGYAAGPILLTAIVAKPSWAMVTDMLWPREAERRLVTLVFILPLLLPTVMAIAAGEKVVSLWAIAGMTLLPVVLLASPRIAMPRLAAVRILGIALAFPLLAIVAAPVAAVIVHLNGTPNYGAHYSLVAEAAARVWRETTDRPLRLVGSYNNLLYGSLFYFPDRPSTLEIVSPELTPWTDEARIARDGIVMYCPAVEKLCMDALNRRTSGAPPSRRVEVEIARRFLGMTGPTVRYIIVAVPPR
jgi:hypothetical protein